jgi:hypothetical protein
MGRHDGVDVIALKIDQNISGYDDVGPRRLEG